MNMYNEDMSELFAYSENLESLILPKLEAIRDGGNGATIHDVNVMILKIIHSKRMAKKTRRIMHIVAYREYIRTAQMWLEKKTKELYRSE